MVLTTHLVEPEEKAVMEWSSRKAKKPIKVQVKLLTRSPEGSMIRYVHSYQSYLWNNAVSLRVKKYDVLALCTGMRPVVMIDYGGKMPELQDRLLSLLELVHETNERKPRESILIAEFANAIDFIKKDLPEENRLRFLHWDLHKHFHSKTENVLALLGKVAASALLLSGFFYHQLTPSIKAEGDMSSVFIMETLL